MTNESNGLYDYEHGARGRCQICMKLYYADKLEEIEHMGGRMPQYKKYICHKCIDEQVAINKKIMEKTTNNPGGKNE